MPSVGDLLEARQRSTHHDHARRLELDYVAVHPSDGAFTLYQRLGFRGTDRVLELKS
jgi:hypothetical protein